MFSLKDVKLKPKLIGLFLVTGLIPLAGVAILAAVLASNALTKQSENQLIALRDVKKGTIETYFGERQGDIGVLNETVGTLRREAFAKLEAIQEIKKAQLNDYVEAMKNQLRVLKDDPYVREALSGFDSAFEAAGDSVNSSRWNNLAREYDGRLDDIMQDYDWYDIFLIHIDGDIVYTVAKESDLGMIIPDSELRSSALGEAFFKAQKMGAEEIAIGDFAPYAPSGGVPAAFMMAQMHSEDGRLAGYVAFQIPLDKINNIMLLRQGMGETGESYLVGEDRLMRSDSYLDPQGHSVEASFRDNARVETDPVRQAFAGIEGQEVVMDYNDNPVLSCWDLVDLGSDVRWAMMSEMDVAEAFSPKDESGSYFYEKYVDLYGYYDLFLINPDGYVFFSAAQESDYQTNMLNGKYSSSNLGKLVKNVLNTQQFGFADFEPYAPSNGEPAAFVAQPVVHQGKVEVIVALQLPLAGINNIMRERSGMGISGETYLVGSDKLMRSDSFIDQVNHTVKASFANPSLGSVDTDASRQALAGSKDVKVVIDYNGNPVVSAYAPIDVFGSTWALLAEIDQSEVMKPVRDLIVIIVIIGVIVAMLLVLIALFIAMSIANPVIRGVSFAQAIAEGDLTSTIEVDQKDEIGMLANALREMIGRLGDVVGGVRSASGNVASGSQEMSSSAQQMSQGSTEQAASAEEVSSSMEQMGSNIKQNADNAAQTQKISTCATKSWVASYAAALWSTSLYSTRPCLIQFFSSLFR